MNKFNEAGIRVVGISVDTPQETSKHMLEEAGYTFIFLSDPKLETIRRYDLVHAVADPTLPDFAGKEDADIARPAEFLLDSSGTIRWRMVTESFFKHALPEQLLEAAKALP